MKILHNIYIALSLLLLAGCSDDYIPAPDNRGEFEEGPKVEAYLSLSVGNFTVSTTGTRAAEPSTDKEEATDAENRIDDIWVFQFDAATGQQLINPSYYEITDQEDLKNLKVLLKDGIESTIYVIANTGSADWCIGKDISHITQLKGMSLPNPAPIMSYELGNRCIPMNGILEKTTVIAGDKIEITAKKMFAKLRIWFEKLPEGMTPKSVEINSIPNYCKVESVANDLTEDAGSYEVSFDWITRAFNAEESSQNNNTKKDEYVIYVSENIQGESDNTFEGNKNENAPSNALVIKLWMTYKDPTSGMDEERIYTLYPGGNSLNNFNIRRSNVYRVKVNINSLSTDVYTPSSNCFVVIPGRGLSFEPYYRTETGGIDGSESDDIFKFENYLDPLDANQIIIDEDGEEKIISGDKVIDKVQILWQTKDAIGNNTNGDLVWFEKNEQFPIHSKLFVKTQKEGNALVGAFNSKGEVIWSWHIWITDNNPGNVGNAVVYTTYRWDENKIYSWQQGKDDGVEYERVSGYAIMPCNLGALAIVPSSTSFDDSAKTYGMLYQWGRKDPFPPMIKQSYGQAGYSEELTGEHYDFTNSKKISKTSSGNPNPEIGNARDPKVSFYSKLGNELENIRDAIKYTMNNPAVFICGTKVFTQNYSNGFYSAEGDWLMEHNDKLWGGKTPIMDLTVMKYLTLYSGTHVFDNYGDKKTIFDPCPSGWRVPPGDLWLGFSRDGKNPNNLNNINYDVAKTGINVSGGYNGGYHTGMYLYMTKSKWDKNDKLLENPGPSLFFPTQGPRLGNGYTFRVGTCGNYHNATSDLNNRLNILHVHNEGNTFKIFEAGNYMYLLKSVGGSVRCVRDKK